MTIGRALATARAKLQQRFSNRPNVIQTRSGAAPLSIRSTQSHWIVGRDLCMYRCEDFGRVPQAKRRAALALKLPIWSPFQNTGHHCVWAGGLAMAWIWNADEIEAGREEDGAAMRNADIRVLPETVFLPKQADGLHLQSCREGFDLQYWADGVLHDSYWLAERPSAAAVGWFLDRQEVAPAPAAAAHRQAAASAGHDDGAMAAHPVHLDAVPWRGASTPVEWLETNERKLVAGCLLALALVLTWQQARFLMMQSLEAAASNALTTMQEDVTPMLQARNEWLDLQRRNQALGDILLEPSQAYIMGLVDQAVPSDSARFQTWRYQQRQLLFVVEDADLNPIEYIRSLEAQPLFGQVATQPTRSPNRFEITLRVEP